MKKIEAIIKRSSYTIIAEKLSKLGYTIIDKRNLEDSKIFDKQLGSKVGGTISVKTIPLSKIELVVAEKDARKVIDMISKKSGFTSSKVGKIFVSEMEEVLEIDTLESTQDLELDDVKFPPKPKIKRSRLVPLQKYTLLRLQTVYEENYETLVSDHRIKSFSDFVNHCIMGYLPSFEKQLKHPTVVYGNNFREF
ncbi:MAG: transcriptional regulator [Nitrososphaeria archaeon]|nr:transcriptional regulator [Nitrosopumilaceae archaeon]NIP09202.1 transcriptional regulator [Nitrosopumilaceae archaeon]NIP91731.1 transcriptional regulator [Nitrososphaeria archaeon]NIS95570.1 transcriptional regulator [Nitrosopumilaceae archaeon]